jgi:hypothetical protein
LEPDVDLVFPHPVCGATRKLVWIPTLDALRLLGSSVFPDRATGKVRQGHPMAAIRLSEPSEAYGTGQLDPHAKVRSDGWQMSIRSYPEGKMGQPILHKRQEKLDI